MANVRTDYLMHYGVKGMKWGVRHDPSPSGIRRIRYGSNVKSSSGFSHKSAKYRGKSIVDRWNGKSEKDKRKVVRNALIGAAAVSAATVVGLEVYKLGKMSADVTLKPGTIAQSVAVKEKADWGKSFYVATSQDDRRKILKNFSKVLSREAKENGLSGEVYSNMFTNKRHVKIAGRLNMKRAYKSVYGTSKGFGKFARDFNQYDEAKRLPFMKELSRRGYGGFKDQAGMQKWWGGETPIVLSGGKYSGFTLRNRSRIDTSRLPNIPVTDIGSKLRNTEELGMRVTVATLSGAAGIQTYMSISDKSKKRNQNGRKAS